MKDERDRMDITSLGMLSLIILGIIAICIQFFRPILLPSHNPSHTQRYRITQALTPTDVRTWEHAAWDPYYNSRTLTQFTDQATGKKRFMTTGILIEEE